MSLDGHDKLSGYQKAMFPLCIYGGQDTYSSRINFLRIWTSNNNPKVVDATAVCILPAMAGKIHTAVASKQPNQRALGASSFM